MVYDALRCFMKVGGLDIDGYEVTKDGLVISYKQGKTKHLKLVDDGGGYLQVSVSAKNVPKNRISRRVHLLVWENHVGEIPIGMQINHKDGDKTNNKLCNLECVTPSDNRIHAVKKLGSSTKKILNDEDAKIMVKIYLETDITLRELKDIYKISYRTANRYVKKFARSV